nr:Sensor histidine kinase BtsS [Paraburkholderia busanensis]
MGFGTSRKGRAAFLTSVVLLNCLIAVIFWAGSRKAPLFSYLISSNAIGFSALFLNQLVSRFANGRLGMLIQVLFIAPVSVVVGVEVAGMTAAHAPPLLERTSMATWLAFAPSFLVAALICAFTSVFVRASHMRAALETQRREAAELKQSETAARLALLQAQIEPHFLFNTLANVQSLIERDSARASAMLDSLNRYLRASLGRTRKPVSHLNEELELVEALLSIASMRLEKRLRYTISVPDALHQVALPPLLLQPLVENAVIHGIEPAIHGGEIVIAARREEGVLKLSVADTGVGLGNSTRLHGGVGLANVRARLQSLYGDAASLSVNSNASRGVTASLLIPMP